MSRGVIKPVYGEAEWPNADAHDPPPTNASTDNMRRLNRQSISAKLEALVPQEVKEVRFNSRLNIVAGCVHHESALKLLRVISEFGGIAVRTLIPLCDACTSGIIYDVWQSLPSEDLPIPVKQARGRTVIVLVSRLG